MILVFSCLQTGKYYNNKKSQIKMNLLKNLANLKELGEESSAAEISSERSIYDTERFIDSF
jgi:hypothetical protein